MVTQKKIQTPHLSFPGSPLFTSTSSFLPVMQTEQEVYMILPSMKEMLYEVRCLKSNKDMILALAGQFKQLNFSGS